MDNQTTNGHSSPDNLLPKDGRVHYLGKIFTEEEASKFFSQLLKTIAWKHDEVFIYGKQIITKRKTAWYGDKNYSYTYSNSTKEALAWTEELLLLKHRLEAYAETNFNSCLLNLYQNGDEGMSWHSDDERELGKRNIIASLSLGAERKFIFRHKATREKVEIILENGSLLVMKGTTQANWQHALPKSKKVVNPRINLTFRQIISA